MSCVKVSIYKNGKKVRLEQEQRCVLMHSWALERVEIIPERRVLRVHYRTLSGEYKMVAELDLNEATYYLELKRLEYSYKRDLQCQLSAVTERDYERSHRKYVAINMPRGGWWIEVEPRKMCLVTLGDDT